mmetsp:Transcript_17149/g.22529  ORF Transcript_17149/g.22529 Transcript_17149/m.22529 type:complete len:84 (-) Transcript_17149:211-462(-)
MRHFFDQAGWKYRLKFLSQTKKVAERYCKFILMLYVERDDLVNHCVKQLMGLETKTTMFENRHFCDEPKKDCRHHLVDATSET